MFCWTVSYAVLCWIKNKKTMRQYVQCKMAETRKLTNKELWRFCPDPKNPAEVASGSCSSKELIVHNLCWTGQDFLRNPSECWPDLPTQYTVSQRLQMKNRQELNQLHSLVSLAEQYDTLDLSCLFHMTRYSSKLDSVILVTESCWTGINMCWYSENKRRETFTCQPEANDFKWVKVLWIKDIQRYSLW